MVKACRNSVEAAPADFQRGFGADSRGIELHESAFTGDRRTAFHADPSGSFARCETRFVLLPPRSVENTLKPFLLRVLGQWDSATIRSDSRLQHMIASSEKCRGTSSVPSGALGSSRNAARVRFLRCSRLLKGSRLPSLARGYVTRVFVLIFRAARDPREFTTIEKDSQ